MRKVLIVIFISFFLYNEGFSQINEEQPIAFSNIKKMDSIIDLNHVNYTLINVSVLHFTNEHRNKKKKKDLIYNKTLEKSALTHSLEMKKYNFFSHINKKNKKLRDLEDRAKFVGYKNYVELAENLYYGFIDLHHISTYKELGKTITQAFIDSKTHNINLLDKNLEEIGLSLVFKSNAEDGFLYYYFTQSFGTRKK